MKTDESTEYALEQARCAYVNLNNMVKMMPILKEHPLLPMVKRQLQDCIESLGGGAFCEVEDEQSGFGGTKTARAKEGEEKSEPAEGFEPPTL